MLASMMGERIASKLNFGVHTPFSCNELKAWKAKESQKA